MMISGSEDGVVVVSLTLFFPASPPMKRKQIIGRPKEKRVTDD
jgi:hypothetical protein